MKIATTIVRILFGALLIFSSAPYFLNLLPQPQLAGDMKIFTEGLNASGYLIPMVKAIELLCGIAFIAGRFIPLATILIFPIAINILCVHLFLAPQGLPVALFIVVADLFLVFRNRERYRCIFVKTPAA
jgi:uncharacterized membrane protein YphA (DoxX/SURF4 family)